MVQPISLSQFRRGLLVGLGGFGGATARYLVDLVVPTSLTATLTVNLLGCLALGFVIYADVAGTAIPDTVRLILTTGFIASFTTYSTFVVETLTATPEIAVGYLVTSYTLGFAGVVAGRTTAARWISTRSGRGR